MSNKVQKAQENKTMTWGQRLTLVGGSALLANAAHANIDVSDGVTVIAGAVAAIALVGAAKIVPNATIQVWGYVKQAFNRT